MHHSPRGRSLRQRLTMRLVLVPAALAAGLIGAELAAAAAAGDGLPDRDHRFAGVQVAPSAAQRGILRRLGDVEVGWTELGTPHSLRARDGALTRPSAAAPDAIARGFLRDNATLFRQTPGDIGRLKLTMLDRDASGATILRYRQTHGARDVHGSSMLVVLDPQGRIHFAGGTLAPSLGAAKPPRLSAEEAVARAAMDVSPRRLPPVQRRPGHPDAVSSATFENTLALPALRHARPVEARLVTVPTAEGGRTAWRVLAEIASNAEYELLIDAATGEVLYRKNQWSSSEPHGLVHTGDDPEAGGQVPNVLFSGINGTWVDGDTTAGNNANAYQDLWDDETPDAGDQPSNADQHFDYTWTDPWGTSAILPTSGADRDAVVTQLFYYTNWFHDYAYDLGFTETARNFQNDNFGNGGVDGDAVRAEADDSYGDGTTELCTNSNGDPIPCRNNANFNAGGPDGSTPRMQMYVGEVDLGDDEFRRTQRAMNRDTVIHEYTHGISGRIVSDGNLAGGLQSGALGEGWSDAFATSINNDPVYGEYNNGNYDTGIRGVAYDDSPRTYGDLCTLHPNGCQVHADGTIWATAMWEQRTALRDKLGPASGKSLHERLMMLGLKLTPDTPSFHDARTAYLLADFALAFFGLDPDAGNQCLIWRVFADNELGVTAGPDDDDDSTPNTSTATPASCDPQADIADPPVTPEGTAVMFDGTGSTVGGDDGDTLTYEWELDGDGQFDDSTSPTPSWTYGDDGSFTVSLRVTNTAGYSDTASTTVTITNVAPTVTIDAGQLTNVAEGQTLQVLAHFTDPGWLDTYPSSSVDLGTADLAPVPGVVAITDEGPPANVGTVEATVVYGDNGAFTVEVSLTDDDGGVGSDTFLVTVTNVDPSATIDESDAVDVNGVPTIFADAGEDVTLSARVEDPGSDDETISWDWGDGSSSSSTSRVNPPTADPLPSPTVQPRDFTTSDTHAWAEACMYDVQLDVADDDGGTASDTVKVLITGPPTLSRGAGYWQHQYSAKGKIDFSEAQLDCYLEIAAFLSNVFNEVRDASTRQLAYDDIFVAGLGGDLTEQLDRQLLASWLNFANGGVEYTELLDTDGDGAADTAFVDVMATAESVRLDPTATRAELEEQKDILMRINRRDGV